MTEPTDPKTEVAALKEQVGTLKEQVRVLTDKANQALIAGESSNALWIALMEAATPGTRKAVLEGYLYICKQLDASPINSRRTEHELSFQQLIREQMIAHLKR